MIRRCPAPLTALLAALVFGLGSQASLTRADQAGMADYSITFPNGLPAPTGATPGSGSSDIAAPQVVLLVDPAGGVVAPSSSSTQGPLTILNGSSGFDQSGVYDYLASSTDSNGQPLQALGLSFYGQGMAAGGVLKFSLNVTNVNSPPHARLGEQRHADDVAIHTESGDGNRRHDHDRRWKRQRLELGER